MRQTETPQPSNRIKKSSGGLALQITKPARQAGFVIEDNDGLATRRADVLVYGFDNLILLFDKSHASAENRSDIIKKAVDGTQSIHRGEKATVEMAGNGYQIQLPGCQEAGINKGDTLSILVADGLVILFSKKRDRDLATDLLRTRQKQIKNNSLQMELGE